MREVFVLLAYLLMTLVKLCRPRGLYAVVAESLAVKHQLQVMNRSRRRAPRFTPWVRLAWGIANAAQVGEHGWLIAHHKVNLGETAISN